MLNACPNCQDASTGNPGALSVESFRLDKKVYIEIGCINCARQWTPRTMGQIVDWNRERFGDTRANFIKRTLERSIEKENRGRVVR